MEPAAPSPDAIPPEGGRALGGKKAFQVHRRESSKWIPREPPISQRIIQPIRQRFDRNNAEYVFAFFSLQKSAKQFRHGAN